MLENQITETFEDVDVLVIGGGPAGAWAAWAASNCGAKTLLVDKGYMSTSGAMAISSAGIIQDYAKFVDYLKNSPGLHIPSWQKYICNVNSTSSLIFNEWRNEYATRGWLQGLEIMAIFRKKLLRAGVKILDHSPVLQLSINDHGAVNGAMGYHIKLNKFFTVKAKSVIIASGGCGWKSGTFGCNTNTGDGILMAEEIGARVTSMEFGSFYSIAPKNTTMTKGYYYRYATFKNQHGTELTKGILASLENKDQIFCRFDKIPTNKRIDLRLTQPNLFLVFDKMGINPFSDWWEICAVQEGTMRTGAGLQIQNYETCETNVTGLYAAGDAACRTPIVGSILVPESYVTWAVASGLTAGKNAAVYSQMIDRSKRMNWTSSAGINPNNSTDEMLLTAKIQDAFVPLRNQLTNDLILQRIDQTNHLWDQIKNSSGKNILKSREAAAMIHVGRRVSFAQSLRKETRGSFFIHKEYPDIDSNQEHYITLENIDQTKVSYDRINIS